MKLNKLTIGFGALALMFTACDKAAEQDYTPAQPCNAPAAYFDMDYDGQIIIDENQTEFSIPVYRGTKSGAATVNVTSTVNGNYFSYHVGDAAPVAYTVSGENGSATIPVTFEDGQDIANIVISYPWSDMQANAGKKYNFQFKTDGQPSEYFITEVDYTAFFVPWEPVVGPKGETTAIWKDDAVYTGFSIKNADFEWEVDIQMNPLNPGLYRVLNPYAGAPQNSSGDDFQYHGKGDIWLYINATDPGNVFYSDKLGRPVPEFNTFYTLSSQYSDIEFWDRASGEMANIELGEKYPNKGYTAAERKDMNVGGKVYTDYIDFKAGHFYVFTDGYCAENDASLVIIFPGGEGKKEWSNLGMGTYTEGLLTLANGMDVAEIQVPVQKHNEVEGMYRMVDPYTNYWVEENPQDKAYNIVIDASDPNFVTIKNQKTGNVVEIDGDFFEASLTNWSYYYTGMVNKDNEKTKQEIIDAGLNDTMEGNTIKLSNAVIIAWNPDGTMNDGFSTAQVGGDGNKLVLPAAADATSFAASAASNHVRGLTYPQGVREMKIDYMYLNLKVR